MIGGELAAFDLRTGQRQWVGRQQYRGDQPPWPAVPMRPVVAGGRVFIPLHVPADPGPPESWEWAGLREAVREGTPLGTEAKGLPYIE